MSTIPEYSEIFACSRDETRKQVLRLEVKARSLNDKGVRRTIALILKERNISEDIELPHSESNTESVDIVAYVHSW